MSRADHRIRSLCAASALLAALAGCASSQRATPSTAQLEGEAVQVTEEYTIVQLKRQEELTRRVQDKRAKATRRTQSLKVLRIA